MRLDDDDRQVLTTGAVWAFIIVTGLVMVALGLGLAVRTFEFVSGVELWA